MEAVIPSRSSLGWLGCSRADIVPGRPMVSRKAVTTRHLLAARIRSWLRMILLTAAAISGVTPGAIWDSTALVAASLSRNSRKSPTVIEAIGANGRRIVAVDDQPGHLVGLVRNQGLVEEQAQRLVGQQHARGHRLLGAAGGDAGQHVAGGAAARPWPSDA